jgi:TRAP-type mannitol/chloroaromatic compound transport system permease small subunit
MKKLLMSLADFIDTVADKIAIFFSWCSVILIANIIIQVVLRYAFRNASIKLEELEWHFYAVLVLTGMSYAQIKNCQIRVDILYPHYPQKTKYLIEILGNILLLFPFLTIVFLHSLDLVSDSFLQMEKSPSPEGLPYRWIIKSFITFGVVLLFLTGLSRTIRDTLKLAGSNEHE